MLNVEKLRRYCREIEDLIDKYEYCQYLIEVKKQHKNENKSNEKSSKSGLENRGKTLLGDVGSGVKSTSEKGTKDAKKPLIVLSGDSEYTPEESIIDEKYAGFSPENNADFYKNHLLNACELLFVSAKYSSLEQTYANDFAFDNSVYDDKNKEIIKAYIDAKFNLWKKDSSGIEYKFEKYKDGYRAIIPPLLNRRSKTTRTFSKKSTHIYNVFKSLLDKQKFESGIKKIEKATILFISHYPKYAATIIRDNDNIDANRVQNLIRDYILAEDDNGLYVSVFYDTVLSEVPYCEVYILPKINLAELLALDGSDDFG